MTQTDLIIENLRAQFGGAIQAVDQFRGETTVTIASERRGTGRELLAG